MQKKSKKSYVIPVALSALVVALMGTFVLSGTLAKFTSTVSASAANVPAARFMLNQSYNPENNTFSPIDWHIDNLGQTNKEGYSEKDLYPGASGHFSMLVNFISDVPATAKATVEALKKGAFRDQVLYNGSPLSQTVPVKFLITKAEIAEADLNTKFGMTQEQHTTAADGITLCTLQNFPETLEGYLEGLFGTGGEYAGNGSQINETVHVYWNWAFTAEGQDEADTRFGQYVTQIQANDFYVDPGAGYVASNGNPAIITEDAEHPENVGKINIGGEQSNYGLKVGLVVEQDVIPTAPANSGNGG